STAAWERAGELFRPALRQHHALLRREFQQHAGVEINEAGDGFVVAFERASDAVTCAVAGERALAAAGRPRAGGPLRVRMALHTGEVEREKGDYHALVLHHASRMLVAAHGGQIVCSEITASLWRRGPAAHEMGGWGGEPGVRLVDLGLYRLRDLPAPEP